MFEALFLMSQSPRIDYCAPTTPVVVCVRFQVKYPPRANKAPEYYVKLTNGSSEIQVNRCTYWGNPVGAKFRYLPEKKWCDNDSQ